MQFPVIYSVKQKFNVTSLPDVKASVHEVFAHFDPAGRITPGQTVAVAVGSRGTHDLKDLVTATVACLKSLLLKPFIIPAMGSHGGGTAEGQRQVLAELGITESSVGAPVVSSMDVVSLGRVASGAEVFFAKDALDADHIVAINRIKPHTAFRSEVESGLCKILAVTENALGGTHSLKLARPQEFVEVDRQFLETAWKLLPRIPLDDLDVLLVDEMGKNVSGAGMDPNVIGFWRREGGLRKPDYRILVVLDLTPHSHGNATGIGMADLTTRRVVDSIDWDATYLNAFTSGVLRSARMPIAVENDRLALEVALNRTPDPNRLRMARIVNTGELETFWATEALLPELRAQKDITVDAAPLEFQFNDQGRLLPATN